MKIQLDQRYNLMKKIKIWSDNPSGQVLLATLFFCFVFFTLFIGIYKSGMLYTAKERAIRATDLTVLSAGAVYANGLQLVRLTNVMLLVIASVDLVAIATADTLTEGLSGLFKIDPNFRGKVQLIQKVLFGVEQPMGIGAYPFLFIFSEGLSLASDNQLKNNWPGITQMAWTVPFPPSPIFVFNYEGSSSNPIEALIPNMALKFRTADLFLSAINNPKEVKKRYHFTQKRTGIQHTFSDEEVVLVPNSQNPGQMRVKSGDFKNKFVALEKDVEDEAEKEAEKRIKKEGFMKITSALGGLNGLLNGIKLDVIDRDDPPDHTLILYSSYPIPTKDQQGHSTELQSISEVNIDGDGLAAWKLNDPPYQTQLIQMDPSRLTDMVSMQNKVTEFISSGQIPSVHNIFDMATHEKN